MRIHHTFLAVALAGLTACGAKTSDTGAVDATLASDADDAQLADLPGTDADAATADDVLSADTSPAVPTCGPQAAFDPTASGAAPSSRVGDLTLPTLDGDWNLAKNWTGCDSYVFVFTAPDAKYTYAHAVWSSAPADLLKNSPTNVHYFFGSYDADDDTANATVQKQKDRFDAALAKLTPEKQAAWEGRLHYIAVVPFNLDGWLGAALQKAGVFGLAIDRQQTWRELGSLALPGANPTLKSLVYEVQRLEYEAKNLNTEAADKATVVSLWDHVNGGNGWGPPKVYADVTLPDAGEMAKFDTLMLDMAHGCKDGLDANCPDWDREAYMNVCDNTTESAASVAMACQTGTDTMDCTCAKPDGRSSVGKRACNADGKGYGVCECPCDTEFARQITSYKRQGRWLTDESALLPLLKTGGKVRFRYDTPDGWLLTASLRLSTQGKATRPATILPLWHGEQYDETYNGKFKPIDVAVPATAKSVKIVAIITGHGSGTDSLNCAEFCAHDHLFSVGGKTFTKAHPLAGTGQGCLQQATTGAIPNQFGTWPYGRAGWCPGMDVQVWTADVTAQVKPGQTATVSYQALIGGKPFVPVWTGGGDYKPVIRMSSGLEFEE